MDRRLGALGVTLPPKLPRFTLAALLLAASGAIALIVIGATDMGLFVAIAAVAGGYMAINNIPLIFSAALLWFAHGANDFANAVGPLSTIVSAASSVGHSVRIGIPFWVMAVGAAGISLGLLLFGAKLIRTVGRQLTTLDQARAFCIYLSAAITVIGASALGLPVSSTHIAIGSVFGIGFYRENQCNLRICAHIGLLAHLDRIVKRVLRGIPAQESRQSKCKSRKLVRRRNLLTIGAAWFITVPYAALIAATLF